MKNDFLKNIFRKKSGAEYDVAVMYSGGKDSSYLLHLLKEVYGLRVIALTVDNGYENERMWEPSRRFTEKMGVPLQVISPGMSIFKSIFHALITEQEYFHQDGINHVCFICNNFLWASVTKFAAEHEIPFVASGLSSEQLNSGRTYPLKQDELANSIAEKSTKMILKNAIEGFKKTREYALNVEFREFITGINSAVSKVTTVYPYIYHQVSVEHLKNSLSEFGWTPPCDVTVENYISSGCIVMKKVIGELEKMGIVTLNEREQAKLMMVNGTLGKRNLEFATHDASKDKINLTDEIFDDLDIKNYLVKYCKARN